MTTPTPAPRTPAGPPPLTHAHEGPLVVFLIGMTIRRPHRPDLWGPVFTAMPRMVLELEKNRREADAGRAEDLGFLGARYQLGHGGPWVQQFWRSTEELYAYARMSDRAHLPAWRAFNIAARKAPGTVGIWHETYAVPAGGIETFYGNGAVVSLGAIAGTLPLARRGRTAAQRLAGGGRRLSGPERTEGSRD